MWALLAAMSAHTCSPGGAAVGAANLQRVVGADHYALLNVSPSADAVEIRAAYRRAVLSAHPDKGGSSEAFHLIAAAFNVLSCPRTRCLYDQERVENAQQDVRGGKGQKRTCRGDPKWKDIENAKKTSSLHMDQALRRLRDLLQHMDKPLRSRLMSSIPLRVQQALVDFMKKVPKQAREMLESLDHSPGAMGSACTRLQTKSQGSSSKNSKAMLDIEHLRFYTRWTTLEAAIEQQLILAKLQDRITAASDSDESFWSKPANTRQIFDDLLAEHETSMDTFGISVYVEMRTPEWVGSRHHITSPVLPLEEAIALRSRLLHARSTSWESVREEWIPLLQSGKNSCSLAEAEERLLQARRSFLERQLPHAVKSVQRALEAQDRIQSREKGRLESRARRFASKEAAKSTRSADREHTSSDHGSEQQSAPARPYLSAKILRTHDRAFEAAKASHTRADFPLPC